MAFIGRGKLPSIEKKIITIIENTVDIIMVDFITMFHLIMHM